MEIAALFFLELFVLFLLSRTLQKKLSLFLHTLTRSIKLTVYLMAFVFFPGTLTHEIAHYLMAHLLFIHTGKMELFPKLEGESVKLGSVEIGKTDPFRRLLIGVAPFLVGTSIILLTLSIAQTQNYWGNIWALLAILYILFEIGNTMFSSKKDLEGALLVLMIVLILGITTYFLGFRLSLEQVNGIFDQNLVHLFYQGVIYLLVPIILDLALIITLTLSLRLLR